MTADGAESPKHVQTGNRIACNLEGPGYQISEFGGMSMMCTQKAEGRRFRVWRYVGEGTCSMGISTDAKD